MRHRNKNKILDRKQAPRKAMLSQLASSVILYEKVKTTDAKAKAVRHIVERSIRSSRQPTLAVRRRLFGVFKTELPVKKLCEVLGPRYQDRRGGYTRLTKIGCRKNDAAQMVQIELV